MRLEQLRMCLRVKMVWICRPWLLFSRQYSFCKQRVCAIMGRSQVALVTGKVVENSPFLSLPMNLEYLGTAAQGSFWAEHPYCEHTEVFSVLSLAMPHLRACYGSSFSWPNDFLIKFCLLGFLQKRKSTTNLTSEETYQGDNPSYSLLFGTSILGLQNLKTNIQRIKVLPEMNRS